MNYTRQQQLLSLIKKTISTELREINHELFHTVVVTDVLLSADGQDRGEIRQRFMKLYPRRSIPRLLFIKDTGEIERIDELLETLETKEPDDER